MDDFLTVDQKAKKILNEAYLYRMLRDARAADSTVAHWWIRLAKANRQEWDAIVTKLAKNVEHRLLSEGRMIE